MDEIREALFSLVEKSVRFDDVYNILRSWLGGRWRIYIYPHTGTSWCVEYTADEQTHRDITNSLAQALEHAIALADAADGRENDGGR